MTKQIITTPNGERMVVLPEAIGRMARRPGGYGIPLPESVAIDVLDGMA